MTLGELERRVRMWQEILEPLGVGHWRVKSLDLKDADDFYGMARCSTTYDHVHFTFAEDFIEEGDKRDIDVVIIHEWLHVAWRDYEQIEGAVLDNLGPVAADLTKDRFDHEREGLIQRIAETIFMVHSLRV